MTDFIGEVIELVLQKKIEEVLNSGTMPDTEYVATDNLAEMIEKLEIIHIRMWFLEDIMQEAKTDAELADLKRKVDICFKVKRPKLVAGINMLVNDSIVFNRSLREDSVKLYKGVSE